MDKKECLECSQVLRGRIDKKFCSDYCRNTYNNRLNRANKKLIRNTNNRLRKNYNILSNLNLSGKTKTTRSKLINHNFDFNFFTSTYTTKAGKTYFYIYDQGYLPLEDEYYLLIKRD
jgi:predicted nucleic acid-binding Zn ribbon protein